MSLDWLAQRERGRRLPVRLMVLVALRLGRPAARALLYPIVCYFLASSGPSRRAARRYLGRALGRRPGLGDLFRQYHAFAATILDRIYLMSGQHHRIDIAVQGREAITGYTQRKQGCLLLGSHLGTFEVVRALGLKAGIEVKLVMQDQHAPILGEVLARLNPAAAADIIPAGAPDTLLRVSECLERGGVVGVLGDRVVSPGQAIVCPFLGAPTAFPAGTFRLASLLQAPVVLFFGLYLGGNRYQVHLETLAERIEALRPTREAALRYWTARYAERLEHYCRLAPYNWFNFYDYWGEDAVEPRPGVGGGR